MEKKPVIKIAVVGAESTGKSWLCEALALQYQSVWVKEYARTYFNDSDIYNYTLKDLEFIAEEQLRQEQNAVAQAARFLFCDTAMITLQIWAELEFESMSPELKRLVGQGDYDFYLLCNNAIPWEADPQRLNKFSRDLIFDRNQSALLEAGCDFAIVEGLGDERLRNAIKIISRLV